jgi:chromosome segregation ATPase
LSRNSSRSFFLGFRWTGEWRERNRLRRSELADLNRQIAALEKELEPAAEAALRSELAELRRQLTAHEASKPSVPPVSDDGHSDDVLQQIAAFAERITALDAVAQAGETKLAALRQQDQARQDIEERLRNVEYYADQQLGSPEAAASLGLLALMPAELLKIQIAWSVLAEKGTAIDVAVAEQVAERSRLEQEKADLNAERVVLVSQLDDSRRAAQDAADELQSWQEQLSRLTGDSETPGTITFIQESLRQLPDKVTHLTELTERRHEAALAIVRELAELRDAYRGYFEPVQSYLTQEPLLNDGLTLYVQATLRNDGVSGGLLPMIDRSK